MQVCPRSNAPVVVNLDHDRFVRLHGNLHGGHHPEIGTAKIACLSGIVLIPCHRLERLRALVEPLHLVRRLLRRPVVVVAAEDVQLLGGGSFINDESRCDGPVINS